MGRRPGPFPPPTRGSTVHTPVACTWPALCPAHAGINRPASSGAGSVAPLPRPRGDQPWMRRYRVECLAFAPPARGSTDTRSTTRSAHHLCPARAGINRWASPYDPTCPALLRPRGDQPGHVVARRHAQLPRSAHAGINVREGVPQKPTPPGAGISRLPIPETFLPCLCGDQPRKQESGNVSTRICQPGPRRTCHRYEDDKARA